MSVTVRIPPAFRSTTGGRAVVEGRGSVLSEVIDALDADYPGFASRILDSAGQVQRHVNVFIGQDDARFLDGLASRVPNGTEIAIMPAVAGGSACQC
jgi:molybdopterin converting factor small subunit